MSIINLNKGDNLSATLQNGRIGAPVDARQSILYYKDIFDNTKYKYPYVYCQVIVREDDPEDTEHPKGIYVITEVDRLGNVVSSGVIPLSLLIDGKLEDITIATTKKQSSVELGRINSKDSTFRIEAGSGVKIDKWPNDLNPVNNAIQISADTDVLATKADLSAKANASDVDVIEAKIPSQATAQNQLADKDFVNSSIATATADFKGTVNSVAALDNLTANNNDYAFVVTTDQAGNIVYKRYKYNGTTWLFEYDLNNSSFTAAQWATINSGVTSQILESVAYIGDDEGQAVIPEFDPQTDTLLKTTQSLTNTEKETVISNILDKNYNAGSYIGKGKKYLKLNVGAPVATDFDGFVDGATPEQSSLAEVPDNVYFDRTNNRFIASKGEGLRMKYYMSWQNGDAYMTPNSGTYFKNGDDLYQWNGTTLEAATVGNVNKLTQADFNAENTIYVIRYDFDLCGQSITIPEGCVLEFDGGSLNNGSIDGNISLFGNKEDSFRNVKMLGTISSKFYMYNYDSSFVAACTNGISVMCNLSFDKPILVQTELEGNGHTIQASENAAAVIMITTDDVTVKNCKLIKLLPSEDTYQKRYAIYSNKNSNISVTGCDITGALFFSSEYEDVSEAKVCENITIVNNKVYCNFSSIGEGGYYERDVVSFLGVKNAVFENNVVEAVNVNRIFKISASNLKGVYNITPEYPSDQIIIRNNRIAATSRYGKQIFDLFCGGSNVTIESNEFNISGHGQFLQDKTSVQLKNIKNVLISNNNITIENATLLDIVNNNQIGRFCFIGNNVLFKGSNINYQIDNKGGEPTAITVTAPIVINKAKTVDIEENIFRVAENSGYVGLNLITCYAAEDLYVKNNNITDFGRIATSNAKLSKFVYSNNLKDAVYSTDDTSNLLEVDFQSQSVINVCEIQILPRDFGSIIPIHVAGGTITYLKLNSKQGLITDRLIKLINVSGNPTISTIESIFPIYKQSSDYVTPLHTVGISTDRPRFSQGIGTGQSYYDTTLNKPIWWTGTAWIDTTGVVAGTSTSGTFANKPTVATNNIPVGFKYFCTDKQTTEGATNGIEIIYKGQDTTDPDNPIDVWVDALGRTIS